MAYRVSVKDAEPKSSSLSALNTARLRPYAQTLKKRYVK